jgi:hypothetical protein
MAPTSRHVGNDHGAHSGTASPPRPSPGSDSSNVPRADLPGLLGSESTRNIGPIVEYSEDYRGHGAAVGEPIAPGVHPGVSWRGKLRIRTRRRQTAPGDDLVLGLAKGLREVGVRFRAPYAAIVLT